ncbi:hypothetical protein IMCC20628_04731 (plasmid) [Hoeflea sp. IMCC20628]|nr:hypothetical protein IMCC20628_04731 [Hoeflea sp. IMCC20628]
MRRAQLALDLPAIRQFSTQTDIYLRVEDWVNKTLNFRGAEAVFSEEPDAEADLNFDMAMPAYTIDYFMAVFFPWLDWTLHEYQDADNGAGEVAVHILRVKLSDVGNAALTLDEFYRSELPPFRPEPEILHMHDDREDECDFGNPN